MSFYLAHTTNIEERTCNNVFYFENGYLYKQSNGKDEPVVDLTISTQGNPIQAFLKYITDNNVDGAELYLLKPRIEFLTIVCDIFTRFLENNDNSIGILVNNPNYYDDYHEIIVNFGLACAFPVEEVEEEFVSEAPNNPRESYYVDRKERFYKSQPRTLFKVEEDREGLTIDKTFNELFIDLLNESGKTNVEVYTQGQISRQVFSNIFSRKDMIPKKDTVICLIIGMELDYQDGLKLLSAAGYTLSRSIVFDVVVSKYLRNHIYDIDIINAELNERNCPLLGWKPRND